MASLYIFEFDKWGVPANLSGALYPQVLSLPPVADQKVTFSTAAPSAAFNANTKIIRIIADADFHLAAGAAPTADANDLLHKANIQYDYAVIPGQKISAYDGTA